MGSRVALFSGIIIALVLSWFVLRNFSGPDHSDAGLRARSQIETLAAKIESYKLDNGQLPASLEELVGPGTSGLGPYAKEREFLDPWGQKFYYRPHTQDLDFVLFTLGRDGRLGGSGSNRDLQVEFQADES